jgi:UDP-N-acetyl-D-mannosaminuronic acid dehydrogenase
MQTVVVVGTGYVGLPAALMWAKAGYKVLGVDINENIVRAINERTMLINETELQTLLRDPEVQRNLTASTSPNEGDVFVVAVPTPVHPLRKVADLSYVEDAIRSIVPCLRAGNLVIIESTIPPNTCREVVKPIIERETGLRVPDQVLLAHCPERILPGDIFREIVENDRIIGGIDERSTDAACALYASFVKGELHRTNDVSAELAKLMENTYRDVNIALANEFSAICRLLGVRGRDVIALANKHPRVNILSAGIGVGGHCIPVDPWFLKEVAPYDSRMIFAARQVNDEMPHRIAQRIRERVRDIPAPSIVVMGATYKANCEDMRESPAIEIAELLQKDGYRVSHYDPFVESMRYSSVAEASAGAHLIAVLVSHDSVVSEIERDRAKIESMMARADIVFYDRD